ncbi:glycosyltransferase family 66 protein [Dorcoceras hygrometricum]|uniref:Glycosyltransferase family 66 protein n=1 Tax=Dorcoceras hygrometricum TaxID=472368 RepID=A0A2Z7DCW8_9LAMI|nr:glycosyltransferase family 66 protein [Dorcoceras hygrometricum]
MDPSASVCQACFTNGLANRSTGNTHNYDSDEALMTIMILQKIKFCRCLCSPAPWLAVDQRVLLKILSVMETPPVQEKKVSGPRECKTIATHCHICFPAPFIL